MNELSDLDVGLEIIFISKIANGHINKISFIDEMKVINKDKNKLTFSCDITIKNAGAYNYAFRLFPKHNLLPHKQDFPLVKWI